MPTIHHDIDDYLAADLHGELSPEEQSALHTHLVDCTSCRKAHLEVRNVDKALDEIFDSESVDPRFEQRMVAGFRKKIPAARRGILPAIVQVMHLRAAQAAGVAALLFALVQIGRVLTGEHAFQRIARADQQITASGELAGAANHFDDRVNRPGSLAQAEPQTTNDRDEKRTEADQLKAKISPATPSYATRSAKAVAKSAAADAQASIAGATPGHVTTRESLPVAPSVAAAGEPAPAETPNPALANRKLIRKATVELEIISFDDSVQKITTFANEERGYVATTDSQKQANGKLKAQVVVKVLPENLDRFLQKIRGLGELKNQTLGTEDVTKAYFDTDARLKNARVMEQRLVEMLKKKSDDINDLLQVEKELGRVREEIEQMQAELKFWDSQVQFATVSIALAEKDLEQPAAFLLKETAQLALYTPEVEKIYNDLKALASPKVQITNAQLNRDNTGRVSAQLTMLIAPAESEEIISKAKGFGRVENFQTRTERIAQGGEGISENAKTKRDKVEVNITISRDEQEQALQQTSLRIRTGDVDEKAKTLRVLAERQNGRIRSSTFSRDPNGREVADVRLRVPMNNYAALMQSLASLGKVENVSVHRQESNGATGESASAPADIFIQVYSQGAIVSQESGLMATLRRTIGQSVGAIMWSLRMIGVALAFLAPWLAAVAGLILIAKRIRHARNNRG